MANLYFMMCNCSVFADLASCICLAWPRCLCLECLACHCLQWLCLVLSTPCVTQTRLSLVSLPWIMAAARSLFVFRCEFDLALMAIHWAPTLPHWETLLNSARPRRLPNYFPLTTDRHAADAAAGSNGAANLTHVFSFASFHLPC